MRESDTYAELRPLLTRLFAVDRVENAIAPGFPDVLLSNSCQTIFVELKAEIGKRLHGAQVAWILRRAEKGCVDDAFVVTRNKQAWYIFWMIDVARNVGLVSLDLDHVKCAGPEAVVKNLYQYMFSNEGDMNDTRRRTAERLTGTQAQ